MKISDWLSQATARLESAGIGTARLDALVLAEDAIGRDRAYLLAHPETDIVDPKQQKLEVQIKRRVKHEPLAYVRGKTEFYGREFQIDQRVLEPRPESETMIDLVIEFASKKVSEYQIIDVGTGSGALAITAKLELKSAQVSATDIDSGCLEVAKKNAKKHQAEIEFLQGNLLEPLATSQLANSPLTLLCNLPYVPENFTINPAAMREPKIAIFGGPDGLDCYRQLFEQIKKLKLNVRYVLTESMPPQHEKLAGIAVEHGFSQLKNDDFIQLFTRS